MLLSSFSHPDDCVHSRPGEQASETPSVEILHRDTDDKVFGERLGMTARFHPTPTPSRRFVCFIGTAMADIDNDTVVGTFPVNTYVLLLTLFALVVGPYTDHGG